MTRSSLAREAAKRRLDASIHAARSALEGAHLAAFDQLVAAVHRRGTLLSRRSPSGPDAPDAVAGLRALAAHARAWVRPLEAWAMRDPSPWAQFASLAEHLMARFPLPRFWAWAWLGESALHREWYARLGRGDGVRRLGLPLRFTHAMAHRLLSAPHHLGVVGAIRWAQVVELGGSRALASALAGTRLGRHLESEDFWETVVHFFVNHRDIDLAHVGLVVDFAQYRRFEGRRGITADGEIGLVEPPRGDFAMKGRTLASLLRLVDEWQRELGAVIDGGARWPRSGLEEQAWLERRAIGDGERTEVRAWSIRELCSTAALVADGAAMRHCVALYADRCAKRRSAIWSLQLETARGRRRVLTIDVDLAKRRLRQVRTKYNTRANADERAIVTRWAASQGLETEGPPRCWA